MKPATLTIMALFLAGEISLAFGQVRPPWQAEWDRTVEAAKKEGQVTVYTSPVPSPAVDTFARAHPEIKVTKVEGRGGSQLQRVIAERRAGKYVADVFTAGITETTPLYNAKMLSPLKPVLLLPEVTDESKWWEKRHRYGDPEGRYVFVYIGVPQPGSIYCNTNLVDPKEIKSLWDLLHPKWKGKILVRDPRVQGPGGGTLRFFYHHPQVGPEYLRRLFSEMDVTLTRDFRQGTDWLARGKFALCVGCGDVNQARAQGLPVDKLGILKEGAGLVAQGGTLAFMDKAPHPNAGRLFINWLLSREGQTAVQQGNALQKSGVPDSLRTDIPKDDIPADERRVEGVTYYDMEKPEWLDMRPIYKIADEALEEAKKRQKAK